jgi:hypothetical protein
MTYLEIVNKVLRLCREDPIASIATTDDIFAALVAELVNDAKRYVEDAHNWNQLRETWAVETAADTNTYSLTNAGKYAKIEYIESSGLLLHKRTLSQINVKQAQSTATGTPRDWAVSGTDASSDVTIKVYPTPNAVVTLNVHGFQFQPDLVNDSDELLVPAQPVVYRAYALAARERGEVGGQTAMEIFGVAQQHLSDAIARDADMSHLDFVWHTV